MPEYAYVVVQFYPWFKFYFLCFKLIIIHYNTQKQKKIKFEPRIKLNHNTCKDCYSSFKGGSKTKLLMEMWKG